MPISPTRVELSRGAEGSNAQGSDKLGKNEFLKILTVQLANQDPTKPMDSHAFVAQLAQFSALEQQQNANDTLSQILLLQQSASGTSAASLVGKDALFDSHQMDLASGGNITVNAALASDASDVIMEVDDADGNPIRYQHFGARGAGNNSLTWDGMNDNGTAQEPGSYYVTVTAVDIGGNPVTVAQQARGRITGVTFVSGTPELLIGNSTVPISNVYSISESSNSQ